MDAKGDPVSGLDEACRLLGVRGRVLPSSTEPVVLKADAACGEVTGQVAVNGTDHILRCRWCPPILPRPGRRSPRWPMRTRSSSAPDRCSPACWRRWRCPDPRGRERVAGRRVYLCNLRPQDTETAGYDVSRHVDALLAHGVVVDQVVCDSTGIAVGATRVPVLDVPLAKANGLAHDPARLAHTLADLLDEAPDRPDALAWTCPARRGTNGRSIGTSETADRGDQAMGDRAMKGEAPAT